MKLSSLFVAVLAFVCLPSFASSQGGVTYTLASQTVKTCDAVINGKDVTNGCGKKVFNNPSQHTFVYDKSANKFVIDGQSYNIDPLKNQPACVLVKHINGSPQSIDCGFSQLSADSWQSLQPKSGEKMLGNQVQVSHSSDNKIVMTFRVISHFNHFPNDQGEIGSGHIYGDFQLVFMPN